MDADSADTFTVQKLSASQPLLLVMEARELVQLRRVPTPLNGRLGPSGGFKVRAVISFSNFLRYFLDISKKFLRNFLEILRNFLEIS